MGKLPQMYRKQCFYIALTFLSLAWCQVVCAQEKKAGGYKKYSSKVREESADDLLNDAQLLKGKNPGEALNKVQDALGLSLADRDILSQGRCYILLGEINEQIEEWKLAAENYATAYDKLTEGYSGSTELKKALIGLARCNLKLGNTELSLQYYQTALTKNLAPTEKAQIQLDISEVHYQSGNYADALATLESISVPRLKDDKLYVGIQNQKAKIYARTNEVDKAKNALESSQNTARSSRGIIAQKEEEDLNVAKDEVAGALHEQARYDEEIAVRNQAIADNLESNKLSEVAEDKVGISKAFEAKGETSEAIRELEEAALMADTINNPREQANAFLALAGLYEKNGRENKALAAYKNFSLAIKKSEELNKTRLMEKADLIKKQRDIEELTKDIAIWQREETIAEATVFRQQLIIYGLLLIVLITAVTSYFTFKNAQASKSANQLLALKSLRSQMNPHFIFNALNSVNQFVAQNDERTTNKFLSEFSRLMRLVMENSQEDFIPLEKEQEIISLYLKLEHYRFRDKFDYSITVDDEIKTEAVQIPPMLIQPYIENAVWHGLRYKETKGHLQLNLKRKGDGLQVEITDDGIGRKRSAELKTENQKLQNSTGLKNIQERLKIINKIYKAHYDVQITDLDPENRTGTRVVINVPEHKQNGKA
jgi:tetratricopeptide (TPR) repeat protein